MGKLKNILKQHRIPYEEDDSPQVLNIRACEVCRPVHSYCNWTGDRNKDYADWNKELMGKLQPFINNGHLVIIGCEDCCACGDW